MGKLVKSAKLWKISVATTAQAEEAVVTLVETTFSQPAISYTDADTGRTTISVYLAKPPDQPQEYRARLGAGMAQLRRVGLEVGLGKVSFASLPAQDWAESWKRHFRPMTVGSVLLIKPSWSRRRARRGQATVVLDPGLSFGTGQHPTTWFCLRQLVQRQQQHRRTLLLRFRRKSAALTSCRPAATAKDLSFLDIGTGSGILAIAAAKLGYAPVEALEIDAKALRIARANARRNGIGRRIRFFRADLARLPTHSPTKFSVICANLVANLLLAEQPRILARLENGGLLVLAGILGREFPLIQRAYEAAGLKLAVSQATGEWQSASFVRGGKVKV